MTTTSAVTSFSDYTGASASDQSTAKLSEDLDTFLTLLTTQLKHQDPLSPMDSTEFTNQLVQYSSVEQQIQTNSNLEDMIAGQNTSLSATAVNYIGHSVQIMSHALPLQDGNAKMSYNIPEDAKTAAISIKDAAGKTVYTTAAETTVGNHEFTWDGKDNNGNQLDDGAYYVDATAIDLDSDKSLSVLTTVFGKVTAAGSDENGVYLGLGDVIADIDDVLTIRPAEFLSKDDVVSEETTTEDTTTEEETSEG